MTRSTLATVMPTFFCLILHILQQDDVLGGVICLDVVLVHVGVEHNHVNGMKTPAVGIKEGHNLEGCDLCVESVSILQVIVPHLIYGIPEGLGGATFGRLLSGKVAKARLVGSLRMDTDSDGGIVGNGAVIEGQAGGANKCCIAMVGRIPHGIHENTCERMGPPQEIVGNHHEEGGSISPIN